MTEEVAKTPQESAEEKPLCPADAPLPSAPAAEEKLPEDRAWELVGTMLVEGYTFEDTLETVNARAAKPLTLGEVEHFYRSNLDVQKGRIHHLIGNFEKLITDLGNLQTAEGKLAEATFLNGYLNLHRPGAGIGPWQAERWRHEKETLKLRLRNVEMKEQRARELHELHRIKIRHDLARLKILRKKIIQLEALIRSAQRGRRLGGETLQRIQEIYGIVTEPINPPPKLLNAPQGAFQDPECEAPDPVDTPAEPPEGDAHE
jgi:hypothetical protein